MFAEIENTDEWISPLLKEAAMSAFEYFVAV